MVTVQELCYHGQFETLDSKIDELLAAPSTEALFELVLKRLDEDFVSQGPSLVGKVLSALHVSRNGLAIPELQVRPIQCHMLARAAAHTHTSTLASPALSLIPIGHSRLVAGQVEPAVLFAERAARVTLWSALPKARAAAPSCRGPLLLDRGQEKHHARIAGQIF